MYTWYEHKRSSTAGEVNGKKCHPDTAAVAPPIGFDA